MNVNDLYVERPLVYASRIMETADLQNSFVYILKPIALKTLLKNRLKSTDKDLIIKI